MKYGSFLPSSARMNGRGDGGLGNDIPLVDLFMRIFWQIYLFKLIKNVFFNGQNKFFELELRSV